VRGEYAMFAALHMFSFYPLLRAVLI
jgi:hypothetical protein